MTSHAYHPRAGTPDEPILFDGCDRCSEAATDPVGCLDSERLRRTLRKAVLVEHFDDGHYRSRNERVACRNLWRIALFLERYRVEIANADLDPWSLFADVTP